MANFLYSFNWCIDSRVKAEYNAKRLDTITPFTTEHGKISAAENPYDSYMKGYIAMFRIELNDNATARLLHNCHLRTCQPQKINIYIGLCGMMTIEIFGTIGNIKEEKEITEKYDEDMITLATHLPVVADELAHIIEPLDQFLDKSDKYKWGIPNELFDSGIVDASESSIYTYNIFSNDDREVDCFMKKYNMPDAFLNVNKNKVWQIFANFLWHTTHEINAEEAHNLSFSCIPAAWEVLIYDLGAICCKNIMKLTSTKKIVDNGILRGIIDRDNLTLLEIKISEREQRFEYHQLTMRSKKEYNTENRRSLFLDSQKTLKYTVEGLEAKKQNDTTSSVGFILSILTAMSVYSVFGDIYSLLNNQQESIYIHTISALLLSFATLVMIIILYIILKNKKGGQTL